MTFAGVDFSSKSIDVVFLNEDDDHAHWHRYDLTGRGDSFDACRRVRDSLPARSWWADEGVLALAVERPFVGSRKAMQALGRIQGAIIACLPTDMLVTELPPAMWKLATVGHGNAEKQDVAGWVLERCRQAFDEDWPQDALDAYAIAWAVRGLVVTEATA